MSLREMWLTLIGRPDKAADVSRVNGDRHEDSLVETLDWFTTDSPNELKRRAERAAELMRGNA